jgi:hypothetical protein
MVTQHEIIAAGYEQFKKALLPAVLTEDKVNGKNNSTILGSWLVASGINVNQLRTPEAVADALRRATEASYRRLIWKVRPAKLVAEIENTKGINLREAGSETQYADKVRADEVKKAQQKADAAAQKATDGIIASFKLQSAAKTEKYQIALRARVNRSVRFGTPWAEIERDIREKTLELYAAEEKSYEMVGIYRDTLSQVEV